MYLQGGGAEFVGILVQAPVQPRAGEDDGVVKGGLEVGGAVEAGGRAGARGAGRAGGCGEGEVVEVGRVELLVAGGCLDEDAGWRLLMEVAWFTE